MVKWHLAHSSVDNVLASESLLTSAIFIYLLAYIWECFAVFQIEFMSIFLVGYPQTPEPVIPPSILAQIDLSCVEEP